MRGHQSDGLHLAGTFADVAAARRYAAACCAQWSLTGSTDAVTLVVSELVTNAARHTAGPIHLRLTPSTEGVLIEVDDPAPHHPGDPPLQAPSAPLAETGRGLALVDAVARAWGVTDIPGGKRIWAAIRA